MHANLQRLAMRIAVIFGLITSAAKAQDAPMDARAFTQGARQHLLQRFDVPESGYELQLIRVEFAPGLVVARHAHPGPEASYVLQGDLAYVFDGKPAEQRQAGESITIPAHAVHGAHIGPKGAILINSFVIEKGKPLSLPAPPR